MTQLFPVTDVRTVSQISRDLRIVLCGLMGLDDGSVFPANKNGSVPTNNAPFATLLIVHVENARPFTEATENNNTETVIVAESIFAVMTANISIFRPGAYDRANLLARLLTSDHGARALRTIAVGTIDAHAVDLTSTIVSTLWEERGLVVAKFSVLLQNTEVLPAIDSASATVSFSS